MMRGGSIFAKYCRKPGSRHFSSSSNQNRVETVEDFGWGWPSYMLYGVENVAYKTLLVYIGYKLAVVGSKYDPEKSAREIEALREKTQLLEKKEALLEARRMEIPN